MHSGRPQICIPIPCALVRLININAHGNLRERFQNVWLYFLATPHLLREVGAPPLSASLGEASLAGGFTEAMINSAWVDLHSLKKKKIENRDKKVLDCLHV